MVNLRQWLLLPRKETIVSDFWLPEMAAMDKTISDMWARWFKIQETNEAIAKEHGWWLGG